MSIGALSDVEDKGKWSARRDCLGIMVGWMAEWARLM